MRSLKIDSPGIITPPAIARVEGAVDRVDQVDPPEREGGVGVEAGVEQHRDHDVTLRVRHSEARPALPGVAERRRSEGRSPKKCDDSGAMKPRPNPASRWRVTSKAIG